jgi:signal transduction histidine kinase
MEALIDGLLQYSRVGRVRTELEPVNVEVLLAEVIDSLAPPSEFTVKVMPGMPRLMTERLALEQVFANLIGNAIKHNHRPDGQIIISVDNKTNLYEFTVADNGPGIAPEFHEKIFVMFQTLEARDKVENTGIGLAIVKKIIEDKGGTIFLESQVGQGATFRFTWPKQLNG